MKFWKENVLLFFVIRTNLTKELLYLSVEYSREVSWLLLLLYEQNILIPFYSFLLFQHLNDSTFWRQRIIEKSTRVRLSTQGLFKHILHPCHVQLSILAELSWERFCYHHPHLNWEGTPVFLAILKIIRKGREKNVAEARKRLVIKTRKNKNNSSSTIG